MDHDYVPGVCNIGAAEIARRRRGGHLGLAATLGLLLILVGLGVPKVWRLSLALPAAGAAASYLQARARFCAYYGLRGLFNVGPDFRASLVNDAEALRRDRRKALRIAVSSVTIGLAVALCALLI
jgi:hypothetical protein